jgi:hypothetical protein
MQRCKMIQWQNMPLQALTVVKFMTRYKGSQSAKAVERDFPHFVDIVVPLGGLGSKLDAMYDFHTRHGVKAQRGHGRHDASGAVIRWCFADAVLADAFAGEFAKN